MDYRCCVIERNFGKDQEAEFKTLQEAREFAHKFARVSPIKNGPDLYFYVSIQCIKCNSTIECIYPQT
jgi:hypothetical protein